jgi:aminomethyltransferase
MDESRTPFHVGLDRWIRFDKGDFVGREALLRVRDAGVEEAWTGLVVDDGTPAATGARVLANGEDAGFVTYSDHGHSLGITLATAHLNRAHTAVGTELGIVIDGVPTRAVVSRMPFFDPEGRRLRA